MKTAKLLVILLVVSVVAVTVTLPILANPGGVGPGNKTIGCGGSSKHTAAGSAVISMGGSPMNPTAGQQVSVWVNVTSASVGTPLGVMISSSTASTGSLTDGWSVVTDPAGTAFNFNQVSSATAGQNSFKWTLTAPTSGSHILYSKAFYAGPSSTTDTQGLTFTVNGGTAPSIVINTPAASSTQSGTSMSVTATITSGTSALQTTSLSVDGVAVGPTQSVTNPTWTVDTTLYTNASHSLTVTATSTAGTGTATRSVIFSNPGPTVVINSPASGSTISGTVSVTFSATPLPGSALGSTNIKIDDGTSISVPQLNYQLDTTGLSNGIHVISATATDNLGRSSSNSVSFTVSNQGPLVSIVQPSPGSSVSGNITVNATATPGLDTSPIVQVVLSVDGTPVQTLTASPFSFRLNTSAYSNGPHSLTVKATDSNQNVGSQTIGMIFSNGRGTSPTVIITSPAFDQVVSGIAIVSASVTNGTNPLGYVTMSVNGTLTGNLTAGPFNFTLDTRSYQNGSHAINVTAHDSKGLQGSSEISLRFINPAPTIPRLSVNVSQQNGSALVSVSVNGSISYVTVSVDGMVMGNSTAAPFDFTIDTTSLSDGQHDIIVTATGPGGSSSAQANISVSNPVQTTDLSRWEATIIGGSLFLVGAIVFLVASVLMLRRSKMRRLR
jgi:chitinase